MEGGKKGKREDGEAVKQVGSLGDMTLIEAGRREVKGVVWWAWKISYFS